MQGLVVKITTVATAQGSRLFHTLPHDSERRWVLDAAEKADQLASTYSAKLALCESETNYFSSIDVAPSRQPKPLDPVAYKAVEMLTCLKGR